MNNRIKKDKFSQYKPDIFYRDPTRVPTIFSDKDLKVNFKNFAKYKKILVTGQSGSGKTTVSKKLAKKYHCDIVHLDDVYKLGKPTILNVLYRRQYYETFSQYQI